MKLAPAALSWRIRLLARSLLPRRHVMVQIAAAAPGLPCGCSRAESGRTIESVLRTPVPAHPSVAMDVQQGYRSFCSPVRGCLMANVTDPLLAGRARVDGADDGSAGRLPVGMSTRRRSGGLMLAAPGPLVRRVLDPTGLMIGVPVYFSVGEAAGVASPQRAARPVPESDAQAIVARLPTVRPGRQQEEGQRDRHPQPAVADAPPHCR
jgi:hypothetical protein